MKINKLNYTLISFALYEEAKDIISKYNFTLIKDNLYECKIDDINYLLLITKVGVINTSISLIQILEKYIITRIINIGYAGAFNLSSKCYEINKIYFIDSDLSLYGRTIYTIPSFDKILQLNSYTSFPKAKLLTSSKFQTKKIDGFDNYLADMEGACIAYISNLYNIDLVMIKVVSDYIDKKNQVLDYKENETAFSNRILDVFCKIINGDKK